MTDNTPLLQLDQVVRNFDSPAGPLPVLKGVSLSLDRSDQLAIVGPSGTGKSTLLHLMGGLDLATEGSVKLAGEDWASLSETKRARRRGAEVGFVFQNHFLLPHLDLLDNVLVPVYAEDRGQASDLQRAKDLLKRVGLAERMNHRPGECSGGECQRVAVVRALINAPRLLLADEPTGALDEDNAAALIDLFLELNETEQVAVVMITHAPDLAQRLHTTKRLHDGLLVDA